MARPDGLSVRLKLTISYAGLLIFAGILMVAAIGVFYYVPDAAITALGRYVPDMLREPVARASAVLSFLWLFGLVGGWFLAGRMLAPLARITDATRKVASGSLTHRISLEGSNDEFRELADSFDAMLVRLEAHVGEQRRFAANASHELRTPLAITQTLLDVARSDPNRITTELIERLHTVNARAINLTEALLMLSRADQRSFTPEPVDLSLIADEATETLLPLAEQRGLSIETFGELAPTIGSAPLLLQVTMNLVHNAIVHNLPERGWIWVTTSVEHNMVLLKVENSGEQLSPSVVATLVEPFRRGSERIQKSHAGVGLGLAIVKSIVQAHDGMLTLSPRAAGGLCVSVQLPLHVDHDLALAAPTAAQPASVC
ncbi:sensor histidine kinase [Herpetosiphon sp. NSE202]|uniref:sensor histidine kinase n=1 Tax=Herpetosiphon sp. NSE202 TaxID=3351349 RepID=UPI00362B2BCE